MQFYAKMAQLGVFVMFVALVALVVQPVVPVNLAVAAGGSYSLDWAAADPGDSPTYSKVQPSSISCPEPSGSAGRATDPLANAIFGNPKDAVESLAPEDMALGQIVPFELQISVSGTTAPENGVIRVSPYWLAKTTNGGDFGFDPNYLVYCAFVDDGDSASVDPEADAKVDSWTSAIVNAGTNNEQIQGTIQVSGLDDGDSVIVEIWVVLKNSIPPGVRGNVQTGLVGAQTASGDSINTGNQTVPVQQVQDFSTPVTPTETPVTPTETPVTPTETPVTPTETPVTPTETPVTPTETPVTPTETPVTPTETPVTPTETPARTPTETPT